MVVRRLKFWNGHSALQMCVGLCSHKYSFMATSRICCFRLLSSWSCPSLICLVMLCCQIISQTLSPTWNQCLPMSRLLLSGDLQYIQREPPHVLIEVYDDDALVIPNSNKRLDQVIWTIIFSYVPACLSPLWAHYGVCRERLSIWEPQWQCPRSVCPLLPTRLQLCSTTLCTVGASQGESCWLHLNCCRSVF